MIKYLFLVCITFLVAIGTTGCSSEEEIDPSIIGEWELESVTWVFGNNTEIPSGSRDVYIFNSNGRVSVINNNSLSLFMNAGDYSFHYDKTKQTITINGEPRSCIITGNKMSISGNSNAYTDSSSEFIFNKR